MIGSKLPLSPPTCDYCGGRKFDRNISLCDQCRDDPHVQAVLIAEQEKRRKESK